MRNFYKKLVIFSAIIVGIVYLMFLYLVEHPSDLDMFYPKISQGPTNYLITGSSASFHGLNPDYVFEGISEEGLNFAFSNATSPYGKVYLENIKKKVNVNSDEKGIFILGVNPLLLSVKDSSIIEEADFRENELFLSRIRQVNASLNLDYLLTVLERPYYFYLTRKVFGIRATERGFDNGWFQNTKLQADSLFSAKEIEQMEQQKHKTIKRYEKEVFSNYQFAQNRLDYFLETISFLQEHGTVYAVRIPLSQEMETLHQNYMPNFDNLMSTLAEKHNYTYHNLQPYCQDCTTVDGNHLTAFHANNISKILNRLIKE